jgi:hypothetical protein
VPLQLFSQFLLPEGIGKQILDSPETRLGSGLKPVEKIYLVEHHGQIGAEFGHGFFLLKGCIVNL